jgi:mono/diheme cytochrome c family protein
MKLPRWSVLVPGLLAWLVHGLAMAAELPAPALLQAKLGQAMQAVQVVEPHLSVAGQQQKVRYLGHPAALVFDQLLGRDWRQAGREIELRALDGFVSRVPVERFAKYQAWLVQARADGAAFVVDNHAQHEKQVPLGPYYLVWDNIAAPELVAEGGAVWPYQVASISLKPGSREALLPGGLASAYAEHAELAQKYCLSCHQVNGYGGDKMPLNLAVRAKLLDERTWHTWLLSPQTLKLGTSMPPLPDTLPAAEREAIVTKLHSYLRAVPVLP